MLNIAGGAAATGYNLTRSLRFRASASAYLNRTPAGAGNRNTWTYSTWVKRGALGAGQRLFGTSSTGSSDTSLGDFYFSSADKIGFYQFSGGIAYSNILSTQVFRDPSAWYHIVLAYDDTQATAANRVKIYVNGVQITAFDTASYPTQNFTSFFNGAQPHVIGRYAGAGNGSQFDGYLTEINFVNAQALTPSSFGSTNALTGVWQPAPYTGSYGTNGFYLPFTDNSALTTSSNVGLGQDFSGNANYWATNNISITAGVTYDSMTDVPTLTNATTANYAVMNPLSAYVASTLSEANLKLSAAGSAIWYPAAASIQIPTTGKHFCEFTIGASDSGLMRHYIGIITDTFPISTATGIGNSTQGWAYFANDGGVYNNGSALVTLTSATTNDVIGVAFDSDAGTLQFYKNGSAMGSALTGFTSKYYFAASCFGVATGFINFGQRPFAYTPPSGFVELNTFNLPAATIVKGNAVMDATLYTGTGASLAITNAASFQPDLVWMKGRSGATDHAWYDSVRGVQNQLESNTTTAETAEATGLTAFGSGGFTVGALAQVNTSAATYVGWQWKGGGAAVSNTAGTITSQVSANASAGFSVVTYTGTGANATVGHGLGVAPSLIIVKNRSNAGENWQVYCSALTDATYRIKLNSTDGQDVQTTMWNSTAPTSSVFSIGTATGVNTSANTYVAYCWANIAGFSSIGRYTGNGSADGVFVYTGVRSKFVIIKRIDTGGNNWRIWDTSRAPYNLGIQTLFPNTSDVEDTVTDSYDLLSNGFKIRTSGVGINASGSVYIYACFSENPFKNSLAR